MDYVNIDASEKVKINQMERTLPFQSVANFLKPVNGFLYIAPNDSDYTFLCLMKRIYPIYYNVHSLILSIKTEFICDT